MTPFRIFFTDGDTIDVTANTPTQARDDARKRKGGGIVSKVKRIRQFIPGAPSIAPDDIAPMPAHRAGADTWVTAHILLELLKIYEPETLIEITGKPLMLMKMPFGKHFGKRFSEIDNGYLDFIVNKSDMRNDPSKEDVVHSARAELARRHSAGRA